MQKVDVWPLLTPESQAVSRKSRELYAGVTDLPEHPVAAARAAYLVERRHWNGFPAAVAKVVDLATDTGHGSVKLRLYHPAPGERRPLLVFLHGGGYILGNLDTHDRVQRLLALESGWAVLGIDYALAPEHRFPTQILQIACVLERLEAILAGHDVDTARGFALGGDSAGANLSMGTSFELRSRGRPLPRGLLLYYGGFGLKDGTSRRLYGSDLDGLGERELEMYHNAYRSPEHSSDPRHDILRGDLAGLPPVHLVAVKLDPLCDDSVALAEALKVVGVPATLSVYEGVLHGFLHYSAVEPRAMQAIREGAQFLRGLG